MKKNVLIYPYDNEMSPIVRCETFNSKYNIVAAVSPHGWGYAGKDIGYVDNQAPLGINVETSFDDFVDICDIVIFSQSEHQIDFKKFIYPKMIETINRKKQIISLINNHDLSDIKNLALEQGVSFTEYDYSVFDVVKENAYISNIDTPIVSILGLSENMDKFLIQLMVTERLKQIGYNALLIGSRSYTDLVGGIPFPKFMFENKLSETEKIKNFNRFIKYVETVHRPDIIILGIPGGVLPYNKIINNNFGITAFECMQAITSDFCILSLYSNIYTEEYFTNLQNLFKYRYGSRVDAFNITNKKIDSGEMFYDPDNVRTYTVSNENMDIQVENAREVSGMFIFNAKAIDAEDAVTNQIIDVLSGEENGLTF